MMKKSIICGATLFAMLAVAGLTAAQEKVTRPEIDDQEIVVIQLPEDDEGTKFPEPATFTDPTVVRVTGSVRSGGIVTAKVMGKGKLVRKATVRRMIGQHFAIGAMEKEFDVKLSNGTTTIVVTSSVPEDGSLTKTVTYTFTVGDSE